MRYLIVKILILLFFSLPSYNVIADEGMWLPAFLGHLPFDSLQARGMELSQEDIYALNQACMTDGIVIFGRGCTGAMISGKGLLITNHHCGYSYIQKHSSVDNDYLQNGFWARQQVQELPNPGLSVRFMKKIEDVTSAILATLPGNLDEEGRDSLVQQNIERVEKEMSSDNGMNVIVKSFSGGNQYMAIQYQEFYDVRLVGAPPSSIGRFGGDKDNWMWPRHSGDFSLYRVYADEDNNPAGYAETNVPYQPAKYFPISLEKKQPGDFVWLLGYPGSTDQHWLSSHVSYLKNSILPRKIALRDARLDIMYEAMKQSDEIRIQYAYKSARVSNSWKKWKGIMLGLERTNAIEKKSHFEKQFMEWVRQGPAREEKYGRLLEELDGYLKAFLPIEFTRDFVDEALRSIEITDFIEEIYPLLDGLNDEAYQSGANAELVNNEAKKFFDDYVFPIDQEIAGKMLRMYHQQVDPKYHLPIAETVKRKFDGNYMDYSQWLFKKSSFDQPPGFKKIMGKLENGKNRLLEKDPAYVLSRQISQVYSLVSFEYKLARQKVDSCYRVYIKALEEMNGEKHLYPDANFTMRLTYGNIKGYVPRDGVWYQYHTLAKGILQKSSSGAGNYPIPDTYKEMLEKEKYGRFSTGSLPVCFVSTCHTSGGNSGSPAFNGKGQLIGLNFDRCWEGTMSDVWYDPSLCRNIMVDMQYVLFILEQYAEVDYLLDEMQIVR